MHAIVLMKEVPDLRRGSAVFKPDGTLDRAKTPATMNPDDGYALEAAVRLKERFGGMVTVLTMGPPWSEKTLMETFASGADRTILLTDAKMGGADTLATAYALHKAIEKIGEFDFVFCGLKTIDGETGQTGVEVAEFLGIPDITNTEEIMDLDFSKKRVRVRRIIEGGSQIYSEVYPAMISIAPTHYRPRHPTLKDRLQAKKKAVEKWDAIYVGAEESLIGLKGSPTVVAESITVSRAEGMRDWKVFSIDQLDALFEELKHKSVFQ